MTATRSPVPHRVASTVWTLVIPLVLLALAAVVALGWSDELPDPVAVHWDSHGPDGFGSLAAAVVPPVVIGALTSIAAWAFAFWAGYAAATRRLAAGTGLGLAVLLAAIMLGSLHEQRGLTDATQAPDAGSTLLIAFACALAAGILAAVATPGDDDQPATVAVPSDAPRLALNATERAVWRRETSSRAQVVVAVAVALLVLVVTIVTRLWPLALVAVLLVGLIATMSAFHVTVDERGLAATGLLGWPRLAVPLDEVVVARATQVSPLGDFGGWGYRMGRNGRVGVVLRKGEALEVQRTGDRMVVVTVDDAATGAALLNTLADRARTA